MKTFMKNTGAFFPSKPIKEIFHKNLMNGISTFTYRGYDVRMAYGKNEYLKLSCSSEDMLCDLIPLGNEAMSSNIIASYLMDSDDYSELMPTAEWNKYPIARQRELSENTSLGFKCINLRLYNGPDNMSDRNNVKVLKRAS